MNKFQDVEQFRNVLRNVQHKAQFTGLDAAGEPIMNRLAIAPIIRYESTVKIHGSNMSIRIEGDKVTAQSRNNEITPENDCYGFAKFVVALPAEVINTFKVLFGDNIVIFGEYFGKGIQDTVGVSGLNKKWAVFRVQTITDDPKKSTWISIEDKDFSGFNKYEIYSICQFGVKSIDINFENPAESVNKLNEISLKVEEECPVAKYFFNKYMSNNSAYYNNSVLSFKNDFFINSELRAKFVHEFESMIIQDESLKSKKLEIRFSI